MRVHVANPALVGQTSPPSPFGLVAGFGGGEDRNYVELGMILLRHGISAFEALLLRTLGVRSAWLQSSTGHKQVSRSGDGN